MSVNTVANFVTAVNNVSPASKNVYAVTGYTTFPNGSASVVITKNGAAFLTVVYEAAVSQFIAENDSNTSAISVRYVATDGTQKVVDAQQFINFLAAN